MKYIFVAGAPGSKWSSVVKNIYYSPDIDRSDYRDEWTYYHDAGGTMDLMHLGAYFDPGMESHLPEDLTTLTRTELAAVFAAPFELKQSQGTRIIKSHVFSTHLEYLREQFPESPIVLVHRPDDACLGWWVKCGHFDITYPLYDKYYVDLKTMATKIKEQNIGITDAMWDYKHRGSKQVSTNLELCDALNIAKPDSNYRQNYTNNDIKVTVI
jgi:hypothetical protein